MDKFIESLQNKLQGNFPFRLRDDVYTLVIGLGGSGLKFAGETKELLLQRYGEQEVNGKVSFYCLDTDRHGPPKNMSDSEFYLMTRFHDDTWVNGWLNPELLKRRKAGELRENESGAGGTRMIGRWKLFSSALFIMQHFQEIIQRYAENRGVRGYKKLFVIVMTGICGGTGSGIFIDIPYFIRKVVEDVGFIPDSEVSYYGMLELPDSKIASFNNYFGYEKNGWMMANAYAAMKELEYYMHTDTEYTADFRDRDRYTTKERIFTQCFMLSNSANYRHNCIFGRNTMDQRNREIKTIYLTHAIPEAVNIMISQNNIVGQNGNMNVFDSIMSYMNFQGFRSDKNNQELVLSTFGVSKIEIPMDKIILAIFSRVFMGLKTRWNLIEEDTDLVQKVVKREIPAIFKIEDIFDALMKILNIRAFREDALESPDFISVLNTKISALSLSDGYIATIEELRKTLKEKTDEIYLIHGPFFTLKMFETDVYGNFLYSQLSKITPTVCNTTDISDLTFKYANISSRNPFKKAKKAKIREELLDALEAYARYRVYRLLEEQINELIKEISRDYMHITGMVKTVQEIFKNITSIDTYHHELKNTDATIFLANFMDIPYNDIYDKINFLFSRKITWMKPGVSTLVETLTKAKIYQVINERTDTEKELLYWAKGEEPIQIEYNDEQKGVTRLENVISIEEVIQFNNKVISIEQMIKIFLLDIKDNREKNINDIILSDFSGLVGLFNNMAFVDMIILSSPKVDFSQPITAISAKRKEELFRETIERFTHFALPSYPVCNQYIAGQLGSRNYGVTLEPVFPVDNSDPNHPVDYNNIKNLIQGGYINNNSRIINAGLSTMITVNFYFDYGFHMYSAIEDCKIFYDKIKYTEKGVGLHITEGSEEDIRPKLRELVV